MAACLDNDVDEDWDEFQLFTNWSAPLYYEIRTRVFAKTVGLLGLATVTWRWHNGIAADSRTTICPLTTLGLMTPDSFGFWLGYGKEVTLEIQLTGAGTATAHIEADLKT